MFETASIFNALVGIAVDVVRLSMALLSFRGFDTPSLLAHGEQRRSSFFNIRRDIGDFYSICGLAKNSNPAIRKTPRWFVAGQQSRHTSHLHDHLLFSRSRQRIGFRRLT